MLGAAGLDVRLCTRAGYLQLRSAHSAHAAHSSHSVHSSSSSDVTAAGGCVLDGPRHWPVPESSLGASSDGCQCF